MTFTYGIRSNAIQFTQQLLQVLFVGLTIGMMRTVIPALAETEFGVAKQSFALLATFVIAFGVVKGLLNLIAGQLSERWGRKPVLVLGWAAALPIAPLIYFAPSWGWIVFATVLLGINQGLCWSMTQTAQLDLTHRDQRGLTIGLNEFSGYVGLALAGIATAYLAVTLGPRLGLLLFGGATALLALLLAIFAVRETLPWTRALAIPGTGSSDLKPPRMATLFMRVSWNDRRLAALSQAGLVEKFVDALVWLVYPVYFYQRGLSLPEIGWVVGLYGFVWGLAQLVTGKLSDHLGRHRINVIGMVVCGVGVAMVPLVDGMTWWSIAAVTSGVGMALLYPNLSAAVADFADPQWRGAAIGIYRFWRDTGYAVGALAIGLSAQFISLTASFWIVAGAMLISAMLLWRWGNESLRHDAGRALAYAATPKNR